MAEYSLSFIKRKLFDAATLMRVVSHEQLHFDLAETFARNFVISCKET
ncbi:MAG: hypothetical protein JWN76_1915 [Chitinophagaceae bacterium]|nr:hypothetical protein [Chitinophagaceae bacterium]